MIQEAEEPKREFRSKGKNLKRGGAPNLSLLEWSDRLEHRRTLWERRTPKGGGRKPRVFQGETLKRNKARRGANVRSG
jgi:hypothetical protein